jgi:hypothetical protein
LRACSTNAAAGTLIPVAAARKSARCLNRSMEAVRAAIFTAVRLTAVCVRVPGAPTRPCVHPLLPCARGSRDGACVRACSVDRSASRSVLRWSRLEERGRRPRILIKTRRLGPALDFARLIREGLWPVNATACL